MNTEYCVASQIAECGNALGKTTKGVGLHFTSAKVKGGHYNLRVRRGTRQAKAAMSPS
jgi:hypothetical protein